MYILKGFFDYPALYNNLEHEVAPLGELSANSRTFARDKTVHVMAEYSDLSFISFHSIRDSEVVSVGTIYRDVCLNLGQYIYDRANDGTIGSNVSEFRGLISSEFGNAISNFTCGKMIYNDSIWMPEWIQFRSVAAGEDNLIRIWLSDDSFAGQYDEYVIEVVHPIVPYDDFFKSPLWVRDTLKDYDLVGKTEQIQELRQQYPYTHFKVFDFEYTPPGYPQLHHKAYWLVIIYGEAGNNTDIIKDHITDEILDNSNHGRVEWEEILPDLFKKTEFIFVPNFLNYAIPNSDHRAGIYSPVINPNKLVPIMEATVKGPGYTTAHIRSRYQVSNSLYKSLGFGIIGSLGNRDGKVELTQVLPDYFLASNDSPDVNRAHPDTVEWMNRFPGLIKAAEALTQFSSVPLGYSRTIRDGIVYASFYYKHVNYLMVSKSSIEEKTT